MTEILTAEGYEQTKQKLRDLEIRLAEIEKRTDLDSQFPRSCVFRFEAKLFVDLEEAHRKNNHIQLSQFWAKEKELED